MNKVFDRLTLIGTLQENFSLLVPVPNSSKKSSPNSTVMKADLGSFKDLNVNIPPSVSMISSLLTFCRRCSAAERSLIFSVPILTRSSIPNPLSPILRTQRSILLVIERAHGCSAGPSRLNPPDCCRMTSFQNSKMRKKGT